MNRAQRGFSLLEVLVAIALTSGVLLAVTAAVLNSLHATALAEERSTLADDALNALVDLRSATAYDRALLASLANRNSETTIPKASGVTETLTVSIGSANPGQPLIATVTASDGSQSVTEHRDLYWEAPAPGSVVPQ